MNEAWKGFAGLFAVVFLAFYVVGLEKTRERETDLVSTDPIERARLALNEGNIVFYEVWFNRYDGDNNQVSSWMIPGIDEISEEILKKNPIRTRIETTAGFEISNEQANHNREAKRWAYAYNTELAKSLEERGVSVDG
ncbi:MAG: hypothetical protein AAGJ81_13365 [Verrucomicrobiota bacterium]